MRVGLRVSETAGGACPARPSGPSSRSTLIQVDAVEDVPAERDRPCSPSPSCAPAHRRPNARSVITAPLPGRSPASSRRAPCASAMSRSAWPWSSRSSKALLHHLDEVLAAVAGRRAAEQEEEVVRVAIVAGPAEQAHLVLARLQALAVLAPFIGDELGVDADLGQIGLHHLGHALGVRVVGTLHRHLPQVGVERCLHAGLLEHLLGLGGIVGVVLDRVVIGPDGRRDRGSWPAGRRPDRPSFMMASLSIAMLIAWRTSFLSKGGFSMLKAR